MSSEDDLGGAWEPVADHVLLRLRDAILGGEIPPGAKISEPEMAKKYGVSRAPLREAIRRLEERSLVTRIPRQGARVVVLDAKKVNDIFQLREAIEGMAAREAALNITPEEIAKLREALERQRVATEMAADGGYPFKSLDTDYHSAIVRASRNEFLIKFLSEDYHGLIDLCRRQQRRRPERTLRSMFEHQRIVDALADRDPELAELTMRRHVARAKQDILQNMSIPQADQGDKP
ncbi:GntR family transcriptional regulator [Ramlibacter sp. G-1-2-2]|uniref:GntR family transcriptional regulator n=1 Tax=Ramlibacter agri TaxID=2728837 RepID=A0A848H4K6_9BURK|nr:GntR family transcriptional regulator [Ramlibacter agri]NML44439.1 GntR family transcriptional regulator [Ramlibacter agri]